MLSQLVDLEGSKLNLPGEVVGEMTSLQPHLIQLRSIARDCIEFPFNLRVGIESGSRLHYIDKYFEKVAIIIGGWHA